MSETFLAALAGFVLGSIQGLTLEWMKDRTRHRRQLLHWRAELRRLRGFNTEFKWTLEAGAPSDTLPNAPRMTQSYRRLLEETDFWLTDEHDDDNTRQGLIDIEDGAHVLARYDADARALVDRMNNAPEEKRREYGERAIRTTHAYDRELQRWLRIVASAEDDVQRRLPVAKLLPQLRRLINLTPKGTNPPPIPPIALP